MARGSSVDKWQDGALIWDLPTRVFHWLLVLLLAASWAFAELGEMDYHMLCGLAILALLLFRLIWGFVGSSHSRFSNFVRGPGAVFRYAATLPKRPGESHSGHNPLGGWFVLLMLLLLLFQAVTGLFANDDIFTEGPLYVWVSKATSDRLTSLHKLNFDLILGVVGLHVAAVLFYLIYKRENLIRAMMSGRKPIARDQVPNQIVPSAWAAMILLLCSTVVYVLAEGMS